MTLSTVLLFAALVACAAALDYGPDASDIHLVERLLADSPTTTEPLPAHHDAPLSPAARMLPPDEKCGASGHPSRTVTLSADYFGRLSQLQQPDPNKRFFKNVLKWDARKIAASRVRAVAHFRERFGVAGDMLPVVFNIRLRKTSDSEKSTPCPNETVLMGGWARTGHDVRYRGSFGGKRGIAIGGESTVFMNYMVFSPRSPRSTKLEWRSTRPSKCGGDGVCPAIGDMTLVDSAHESVNGFIHGMKILDYGNRPSRTLFRLTLMWPHWFSPSSL